MYTTPISVDVICQFSRDGSIIPMRVRIISDNGEHQTYDIRQYKDLSHQGTKTMPNGVYVTDKTFVYECKIVVFSKLQSIRLYFNPETLTWKMTTEN